MSCRNKMQGVLTASTAVACMLALGGPVVASGGGFGDLLPGPGRCASALERGERFLPGPIHSVDGRKVIGARATAVCAVRSDAIRMAQADAVPKTTEPDESGRQGGSRQAPVDAPEEAGDDAERAFEGNSRPASPDLTLTEERALISRGWE